MAKNNVLNNDSSTFTVDNLLTVTTGGASISDTSYNVIMSSSEQINTYSGANTTSSYIQLRKDRSGGVITANDNLGSISAWGHDGTTYILAGQLNWQNAGTVATNRIGSIFTISTHPDSTSIAATRFTIASTGAVTIASPDSGTGLTVSGGGINITGTSTQGIINATSISFDAGSNVLSAYTVGAWTPVVDFAGGTTGITYSVQTGNYTKIGTIVYLNCRITLSSKGSSTGTVHITGHGFTASVQTVMTCELGTATYTGIPYIVPVGTNLFIQTSNLGTTANLDNTAFSNTSSINFTGILQL